MLRVLTTSFSPEAETIELEAIVEGPAGATECLLALDTGASQTVLDWNTLHAIGYSDPTPLYWTEMIGLVGIQLAPVIKVDRFECLEISRRGFEIVCHSLPDEASVAGLLGLNFFRDTDLRINFKTGSITVRR